jgi:hypothetical protein
MDRDRVTRLANTVAATASRRAAFGLAGVMGLSTLRTANARKRKKKKCKRCGDSGASSTLWAVVETDGTLMRGKGATGSEHDGSFVGLYTVAFERDVDQCAYALTLEEEDGLAFIGTPSAAQPPNVVTVVTRDDNGSPRDIRFHFIVTC